MSSWVGTMRFWIRKEALKVIDICRPIFFDKAISVLSPKIIIAIGGDVGKHFFSLSEEFSIGSVWRGMKNEHGNSVKVVLNGKKIDVVLVMQTAAGVSREERELAAQKIREIYMKQISWLRLTQLFVSQGLTGLIEQCFGLRMNITLCLCTQNKLGFCGDYCANTLYKEQ